MATKPSSHPTERDKLQGLERDKFAKAIGREKDGTMLVLRAHLFAESLLERIIPLRLPRGDKLVESGNFSFAQKLGIVEATDCLGDSIVSSLRNLNRVRNECAHQLGKAITDDDVTRIGSPLGKYFSELRRNSSYDTVVTLRGVISYVCGHMTGACHRFEAKRAEEHQHESAERRASKAKPSAKRALAPAQLPPDDTSPPSGA